MNKCVYSSENSKLLLTVIQTNKKGVKLDECPHKNITV